MEEDLGMGRPVDADLAVHIENYHGFLKFLRYAVGFIAVILIILAVFWT